MLAVIRSYFFREQVMEVETPALCRHGVVDVNLDSFSTQLGFAGSNGRQTLYLQTSPEYAMKRLIAGGSGSIYQICKAFRDGESGRLHNPEFSMLEWYRIGFDLEMLMEDIDRLLKEVLQITDVAGTSQRLSYQEAFLEHCGIDPLSADLAAFQASSRDCKLGDAMVTCEDDLRLWQEYLFSFQVQPELGKEGLCFVHDYPASQCALARLSPEDPRVAERVEVFYQGIELANGFHELTCAEEQRRRFEYEQELRQASGRPGIAVDERLLAALESGLPDCAGVAVGLDRLLMLSVDAHSIGDVLSFPVACA